MSLSLQLFGIFCGILLIVVTCRALIKRNISERLSLFWLFSGLVIIIACLFPELTIKIAAFFGVVYAPSMIFMIVLILIIFGLFYCFMKISMLYSQTRDLAIEVSLLNSENNQLKRKLRMYQKAEQDKQNGSEKQ